jgi:hypothetical protein
MAVAMLTGNGGVDEEACRREVRPLLHQWQKNVGFGTPTPWR